jgi:hypothetical protein
MANTEIPTTPPHATLSVPLQSTPIKLNTSTLLSFTTTHHYHTKSVTAMGHKMKKYMVGLMPVEEFLDDFFSKHELLHYREKRAPKVLKGSGTGTNVGCSMEPDFVTPARMKHPG